MKEVSAFRIMTFFVCLAFSLLCFVPYSYIWLMLNTVYPSEKVSEEQSDEIRELIGMEQLNGITINSTIPSIQKNK